MVGHFYSKLTFYLKYFITVRKPYECETCGSRFSRKFHLTRHVKQRGCDGRPRAQFPCEVRVWLFRSRMLTNLSFTSSAIRCSLEKTICGNTLKDTRVNRGLEPSCPVRSWIAIKSSRVEHSCRSIWMLTQAVGLTLAIVVKRLSARMQLSRNIFESTAVKGRSCVTR